MPLPQPELGLVVHYGFVWSGADRRPPPDAGKDRPCLIVDLFEIEETQGRKTLRVTDQQISHYRAAGRRESRSSSAPGSQITSSCRARNRISIRPTLART